MDPTLYCYPMHNHHTQTGLEEKQRKGGRETDTVERVGLHCLCLGNEKG